MTTRSHGYATFVVVFMATATMVLSAGCPERCECRQLAVGGTTVDCRGRGLTTVVQEIPADATELDLGNNPIGSISRSSFPSASKLRTLRIDGCLLEQLERMTFRNLQMLEVLDLSRNRIRDVDAGAFQGLQYLKILNLNDNSILLPPSYLFRGLNLEELILGGNDLQEIADDLFGATKIKTLNLDNNRLFSLSRQFLRPLEPYIRTLSVSNNLYSLTIAGDAFAGSNFTTLSLAFSKISDVTFLGSTAAGRIDLSGNSLESFVLQEGSALAQSCRELVLRDVGLENLNESVFVALPRLKRLDLSGNLLITFKPEVFRHVQDLTVLDLSRNGFARFPEGFGPQMTSLETLNVSYCTIASINWDNLRAITRLNDLDLSGNRLQVIPENASSLLDSIDVLNLSQNPWHCNCEMQWFRRWLSEEMRQVGQLRCSSPEEGLMLNSSPRDFVCTPPRITFITLSQNIAKGSNVMLSCAAQSDPAPSIVWRAPFGDVLSITPPEDRTRTKTIADWAIHRIKPYQSGWYSCNSTNLIESNITYTYLQVTTSSDEAADLKDLAFPMIPSKLSTQATVATSPLLKKEAIDLTTDSGIHEATTFVLVITSEHLPRIPETTTIKNLEIVTEDNNGMDEIDGYWTPLFSLSVRRSMSTEEAAAESPTEPVVVGGTYSSERSADPGAASISQTSIVIIVVTILGVLTGALVIVVMTFVIYRRRRHRDYPVKEKQRRSSRDVISEKTRLQMSNLDDSGYSSTTDPLNPSKSRIQ